MGNQAWRTTDGFMTFYNMLFGMNPHSDLLLAVLGLKKNDVERFRDVSTSGDGAKIEVYTRTGGGNREAYPNLTMRKLTTWTGSSDDDYDSTYCTDSFMVPEEFVEDVKRLDNIIGNGLRPEFGQHLLKTLQREPTEDDKATAAYEEESRQLAKAPGFKANGHTFVPLNDSAMESALKLAEANGGELRSAWGIMPLSLKVQTNYFPYPKANDASMREHMIRAEINYDYGWSIDLPYWEHCQRRFAEKYPLAMEKIAKEVNAKLSRAA